MSDAADVLLPPGITGDNQTATNSSLVCAHCGLRAPAGYRFCCPGCAAAFQTIQGLGLGRYYQQRLLDPALRPPRPDVGERHDLARYITVRTDGACELSLAVDGLQCGACVWLIESVLARQPGVLTGRVNMTSRHLKLAWRGGADLAGDLVAAVERLGYRLVPFDPAALSAARDHTGRALMRALAVAGFAAGNVMLISIGIWAGDSAGLLRDMGPATRDLLHWVSALIALPAIAYAGRPFFASAFAALRQGRTNMDVPISIGVVLVSGMSLAQTIAGGEHTYFDSAIALLFFLLIGRVLDHRARGQARATAEQLLTLRNTDVAVLLPGGRTERRPQQAVAVGERVLVAAGERIGVDGAIETGDSSLDTSMVTGESLPVRAGPGAAVFAGTLNLDAPLTVRATATGGAMLLADCVRLIEAAEARRGRFVVLADHVARRYAPAVHLAALATFGWWYLVLGAPAGQALLTACAVLIVTCPCALALAVPAVQVIATSRLFAGGMLLKSPTALERLAEVDTVVFDKTGTLTEPVLALRTEGVDPEALACAASLAAASRHPLARALTAAAGPVAAADGVVEHRGQGLEAGGVRLGSRAFCLDADGEQSAPADGPELWLSRPGLPPVRFGFAETLRADVPAVVQELRSMGLQVHLLSGDCAEAVAPIAAVLGISAATDAHSPPRPSSNPPPPLGAEGYGGGGGNLEAGVDSLTSPRPSPPRRAERENAMWQAGCTPVQKVAAIDALRAAGRRVLMVGDGLNDSPSLAAASVSASPATAADLSQTVADLVFQGRKLAPVAMALRMARRARRIMRQNLVLAIGYNALAVPLAMAGYLTPWLAAAAMSSSSLLVIGNSFRLKCEARP